MRLVFVSYYDEKGCTSACDRGDRQESGASKHGYKRYENYVSNNALMGYPGPAGPSMGR